MADEADEADRIIEAATEAAIQRARIRKDYFPGLQPTGFCAWCGDPVAHGRLHCAPVENDCEAVHLRYLRFRQGEM